MKNVIALVCGLFNLGVMSTLAAGEINDINGLAILGYDPVGYFNENKSIRGHKTYSFKYQGSDWHFVSEQDRDLFAAAPEKYKPQFGGFCANGLSQGHKIEADPEIWLIFDGKLYMFFSEMGRDTWINTDYKQRLAEAQETWRELKQE